MANNLKEVMAKRQRLLRILLVEDSETDYILTREQLVNKPFNLVWAKSLSDGLKNLKESQFDAILLDLALPDDVGLSTFDTMHTHAGSTPIIVLCGLDNDLVALAAVQRGAQDYLLKERTSPELLERALYYAIERTQFNWSARKTMQQIFDEAPFAIARLREDLVVSDANSQFSSHLNITTESAVGQNILTLLPNLPKGMLLGVIEHGTRFSLENYSLDLEKTETQRKAYFDLAAWPIKDRSDKPTGAMFMAKAVIHKPRPTQKDPN